MNINDTIDTLFKELFRDERSVNEFKKRGLIPPDMVHAFIEPEDNEACRKKRWDLECRLRHAYWEAKEKRDDVNLENYSVLCKLLSIVANSQGDYWMQKSLMEEVAITTKDDDQRNKAVLMCRRLNDLCNQKKSIVYSDQVLKYIDDPLTFEYFWMQDKNHHRLGTNNLSAQMTIGTGVIRLTFKRSEEILSFGGFGGEYACDVEKESVAMTFCDISNFETTSFSRRGDWCSFFPKFYELEDSIVFEMIGWYTNEVLIKITAKKLLMQKISQPR